MVVTMNSDDHIPSGIPEEVYREMVRRRGSGQTESLEWLRSKLKDQITRVAVTDEDGLRDIEVARDESISLARREAQGVSFEMRGPPARHEDGVPEVLGRLGRSVSTSNRQWTSEPKAAGTTERGSDGILRCEDRIVEVQVTRALPSDELMGRLARDGRAGATEDFGALAATLVIAAQRKQALAGRETMALAVDAVRLPHVTFPAVLEAAERLAPEFRKIGFAAVFLVGPDDRSVTRLDDLGTDPFDSEPA
jgi:hypothetical protein